jgi:acyl carrier protein
MGLDLVELAMDVETQFRLSISPADGAAISTAGDLHRYVCQNIQNGPIRCVSQQAFYALRRVLQRAGVARSEVRLESQVRLDDLDWFVLDWELGQPIKRPAPRSWSGWLGWRPEVWSIRELVVALGPQLPGQDWIWSEARIWSRLVEIITATFGVPAEMIKPETDFVLDLGAC